MFGLFWGSVGCRLGPTEYLRLKHINTVQKIVIKPFSEAVNYQINLFRIIFHLSTEHLT